MPIERIRCAAVVLSLLAVGFLISGIVLIALTESIIKKAVTKVAPAPALSLESLLSLD